MEELTVLNKEAVVAASSRSYREALEYLEEGRRMTQNKINALSAKDYSSSALCGGLEVDVVELNPRGRNHMLHPSCDHGFAFFEHLLSVEDLSFGEITLSRLLTFKAILSYNIGVVYHYLSLDGSDFRYWGKAMSFYRECFKLILNLKVPLEHFGVLLMAVCNNAGHLHSIVFRKDACACNMEMLRALVARMKATNDPKVWAKNRASFFDHNVTISRRGSQPSAAAA